MLERKGHYLRTQQSLKQIRQRKINKLRGKEIGRLNRRIEAVSPFRKAFIRTLRREERIRKNFESP